VNTPMSGWLKPLKSLNAELMVFEIFRSDMNKHIYKVNGYTPVSLIKTVSNCYFTTYLPNFLLVESPNYLIEKNKSVFKIKYKNTFSIWKFIAGKKDYWLIPVEANPLPIGFQYILLSTQNNDLILEENR
jgi:hypothetical protein